MAIRGNVGTGVINVLTSDTTIFQQLAGIDRYQIVAFNVHNTVGSVSTINVYVSPDLTSASGDLVASVGVNPGDDVDINAVIGQGYANLNIIAVASIAGLNASLTRTEYSGGD